jgi:hypothetical protein
VATRQREFNHTYILHGRGGLTVVQSRLGEHGKLYSIFWDPDPPEWRLHFLTDLQIDELAGLLEDVKIHFIIRLSIDESRSAQGLLHRDE